MKKLAFVAAVCGVFGMAAPAYAGCVKGAIVGGIAGHMAGHGVAGAAAGCAIGHHSAKKKQHAQDMQKNSNQTDQKD